MSPFVIGTGAVGGWRKCIFGKFPRSHLARLVANAHCFTGIPSRPPFEMLILSITGACCGATVAWLLFDGKVVTGWSSAVELSVSPRLLLVGIGWALVLAVLSGVPTALRAGRLSTANGLRAV
jgi:hypothetical protein